jgi:hypothetical protein
VALMRGMVANVLQAGDRIATDEDDPANEVAAAAAEQGLSRSQTPTAPSTPARVT